MNAGYSWRARIEYCLRKKWDDPSIKNKNSNYSGAFIAKVLKDGTVKAPTWTINGTTNVGPAQLIEDLSGDPILNFPTNSRADFAELYIVFSDYKEKNLLGEKRFTGSGP